MALFGVQFVLSVAMATILQKISPFISLGKWILCNEHLVRYLHPSDEELRSLIGKSAVSSNKGKVRKGAASDSRKRQSNAAAVGNNIDDVKTFTVPCNVDVHLTKATIEEIDLLPQFLYHDYKWLIDFSFCAAVINVLVEILAYFLPEIYTQELNLGLVWNCLVIFFAIKVLISLVAAYWRGDDTGERSICLVFGLFFFVVAMAVLVIDESLLDFGLDKGYDSFSEKVAEFMKKQSISSRFDYCTCYKLQNIVYSCFYDKISRPLMVSEIRLERIDLLIPCFVLLVALFLLMSLILCISSAQRVLLHLNFLAPLFLVFLWVTPIVQGPLMAGSWHKDLSSKDSQPILTEKGYHNLRFILLLLFCGLRLSLVWRHLQSYLDMAHDRIEKMKKETGRISNVDLKRKVARVFYYLSAAALQYLAPTILLLFSVLMLRTLGCEDWNSNPVGASRIQYSAFISNRTREAALSLRGVLTPALFQGIMSYMVWWLCTAWLITSVFGVIYLKIFEAS
ncbi:PREDICTED: transmembrane protein 161B-like [Acropora digitifera]|uniref:transmembrane protein 161B-like n=1 Tax=Acropora digitifera TaxID=70779 RepID=UPI00077AC1FB|nr:PREDICTED: transmembrane protein 161B-like [Acropora digitifera]